MQGVRMARQPFSYQSEKLSSARRALMAPHPNGEEYGFVTAFNHCHHGLAELDLNHVEDEDARLWIDSIWRLMSTEGVRRVTGEGLWVQRARQMTLDEKEEFSRAVAELASWFDAQFWSFHSDR
jgi:hypothetical protein